MSAVYKIDIEIGHPYLNDEFSVKSYFDEQGRFIERALKRRVHHLKSNAAVTFSLLIDDLDVEIGENEKKAIINDIRELLYGKNIEHVNIQYESNLFPYAENLISTIREKYIQDFDKSQFLAITTEDPFLWAGGNFARPRTVKEAFFNKLSGNSNTYAPPNQSQFLVPLWQPNAKFREFGCSLLTAVWYLRRLCVDGYCEKQILNPQISKLENILPQKYLKSEGFAIEIMRLSRSARVRKAAKKIEYIVFA